MVVRYCDHFPAGAGEVNGFRTSSHWQEVIFDKDSMNHSKLVACIVLLSVLLVSPCLMMGFYADDYSHQLVLSGEYASSPMRPWALYDFGRFADWDFTQIDVGSFPWWTDHDWQIRFFRPVSSIALWLQHMAFGDWAVGYHCTSLVLFACIVWAIHGLYRSLGLSPGAAARATLLFAVGDAIALPTVWIANQNTLWETLFAVLTGRVLAAKDLSIARMFGALILAAGAVLSKESGSAALIIALFVLGWRSRTHRSPEVRQVAALGAALTLLMLIGWAAFLISADYGTHSLFYATPWRDRVRFLQNELALFTAGVASLLGPFPLDLIGMFDGAYLPVVIAGALTAGPLALWALTHTARLPGTGWLASWTILFLGLQAAAIPQDRLLFAASVGSAGILGAFFDSQKSRWLAGDRRGPIRFVVLGWWVWATVVSAASILTQAYGFNISAEFLRQKARETEVGSPGLGHRDLFVLQCESQLQAFTLQSTYACERDDHRLTFWNVQHGRRALRWTRVDSATFDVESLDTPFLTHRFEQVYMTKPPAVRVGDRWQSLSFSVEALAVDRGLPTRLRFRLNQSLDDPQIIFLRSVNGRLVQVPPPGIGTSIEFESPDRAGPWMP
jgi:hypothetical protein